MKFHLIFKLILSSLFVLSPVALVVGFGAPEVKNTSTRRVAILDSATAIIAGFASGLAIQEEGKITPPAFALNSFPADNEFVKEQRTVVGKIDVNNSPVADFMKCRGLYPTIAGKIANNGPYASVRDVLNLTLLSKEEKIKLKEYEHVLVATPPTGLDVMRGRDPYRRMFHE